APYQMPDVLAVYLRQSGKSRFLYFKDYSIIASDPEVEIALRELKSQNAQTLVLPVAWKSVVDADRHAALIKLLFFAPYDRAPIANSRALLQPVVDYIQENYEQIAATSNFVVMKRVAGR
ncbi:MAG: hypothetical protein JWQ11_1570, partial [Rhizobacter sp.]|nr:hypothetical protein [Rhizobacter sp.]